MTVENHDIRPKLLGVSIVVSVIVFLVGGCGSQESQGTTSVTSSPTLPGAENDNAETTGDALESVVGDTQTNVDPVTSEAQVEQEYIDPNVLVSAATLRASDARLISQALEVVRERCMSDRGFSYESSEISYDIDGQRRRLFAEPTLDEIREHGYGWKVVRISGEAGSEQQGSDRAETDSAYDVALNGSDSTSGCGDAAADKVGLVDYNVATEPFYEAISQSQASALSDSRVSEALSEWSECMVTQGHDVSSFGEARDLAVGVDGDSESNSAILIAVTDYECREQVNYASIELKVINEFGTEWLNNNPGAIELLTSARQTHVDAALSVVES